MRRYIEGDVYLNKNIGFNGTGHYNNSEESAQSTAIKENNFLRLG